MMGYFYNYGYEHMYGFGWFFMIVFWGLVIWGIIALVRKEDNEKDNKGDSEALTILKKRYAKGDISKKEYEEKKTDLMK